MPFKTEKTLDFFTGASRPMSRTASFPPPFTAFRPQRKPVRYAAEMLPVPAFQPYCLSSLEWEDTRTLSPWGVYPTNWAMEWLDVFLTTSLGFPDRRSFKRLR